MRRLRPEDLGSLFALLVACNGLTGIDDVKLGEPSGGSGGGAPSSASPSGEASSGATTGPGTTASTTDATATSSTGGGNASAQLCVDTINQYRSSLGLPPYARWTEAEECADSEARSDSQTGEAHGAFPQCGESAQNECPHWPGPPESVVAPCLQQMFDEGPGNYADHGHYINMTNRQYKSVSCGFYVTASGSVWVIQDFY